MARQRADWSELYPELLVSITSRFDTLNDFRHCRAVCKKWRSSILQIPQNLPILSPFFPRKFSVPLPLSRADVFFDVRDYGYSIVACATFLLQPLHNRNPNPNTLKPWLFTVEELHPGRFVLRIPLRRAIVENLPDNFPRALDLSDYSVREVSKAYNFRYVERPGGRIPLDTKLVLFFNPACASPTVDDCYALVLHDKGTLRCLRLNDDEYCGYLRYSRVSCFDDIVNYKGCIWAIDRKGRVYIIRYSDNLRLGLFSNDSVCTGYVGDTRKRLVESSEGLYLIDRYHYDELIKFRVYKLNEKERKWNEVKSLNGKILFVATDCCFFVSAEDFPGNEGNCVFFPKYHFPTYCHSNYPDHFYFKGASNELAIGVFHLDDGESGLMSTYPGYSDILWPPPKWLFPDASLSDCIPEEHCSKEMCPSPLALEIVSETQSSGHPCTINGQEQSGEIAACNRQFIGEAAPWFDIPSALLTEIAKHLNNRIDVCRFRAVCKKWRASIQVPLSSNLLSSLLPHKISTTMAPFIDMASHRTTDRSLFLVASMVYLLQPCDQSCIPSKSWLVTVEELRPGKLLLRLPLRRVAIEELPENFPRVLNLSDFHVLEMGKEYNFQHVSKSWRLFFSSNWSTFPSCQKVVLFSDGSCTSPAIDDTTAFILYDRGSLVSFRLSDENWLPVCYGAVTKFDDIVNFKGSVYAIDRKGRAYVVSCNACTITRIMGDVIGTGSGPDRQKRLVVSNGVLYLLVRYSPEDKIYFRVYKLNEELLKWDEVRSLGDKIIFVTPTSCFVASARDVPGWKGNCVVFPADCLPTYSGSTYPDWRFFRRAIEELKIGVYHLEDDDGARLIKFYPGYSDLFWPPPAWLQPPECSSRTEEEVDFPLDHSPGEEVSPDSAECSVEEHTVENSTKCAQQDNAAQSIAAADLTPAYKSPSQASKGRPSTVTFQGVVVRSEYVLILLKIWATYGNIAEESVVHSPSTKARALESLAEAVSILKSNQGRSLELSKCKILDVTLFDLQLLKFRVDWLAPFVNKAYACQKMNLLVDKLRDNEKWKAKILEVRSQTIEMEQQIDDNTRSVTNDINALGPIDLDECLGEGLC